MSEITNGDYVLRKSVKDDSNDNHDDCGSIPSELYGKYTWNIEKFSQIEKREIRSNVFEVGGFKWYVLMYPHGCDVCNHLSMFLCVANHANLLPGWSHFAQFTIAVVNKDPRKSKHSDTLHRFWKKEHDWGWKKFMELPKLRDGFIDDSGSLIIKTQVQVIRENVDRPFRCLDVDYKRELARVYLTSIIAQIFLTFAEEKRSKLVRLIEDKKKWPSLTAFWLGMDENTRFEMFREKMDVILKQVVKHFFIEKEVTSTLVMDSLYCGLKSLEEESRMKEEASNKGSLARIVNVDKELFGVVDDDVIALIEKAVIEPFLEKDSAMPSLGDDRANVGENYDMERDEKLLTEFGRRIIEVFVLDHIFCNKIEVAFEEVNILKMQEELIREEEEEEEKKNKINKVSKSKKINNVFVGKK